MADLGGLWDFTFLGPSDPGAIDLSTVVFDDKMLVPMSFDVMVGYAGKRGTAVYRRMMEVPAGQTARLQFAGVGMWCAVYIDGKKMLEHYDGYEEFTVEVPCSDVVRRELVLVVDNQYNYERNPVQLDYYDWYQHGGVLRPVYLHLLPETSLDCVRIRTIDWRSGHIQLETRLGGMPVDKTPLRVTIDNKVVHDGPVDWGGRAATLDLLVPNPKPWSPAEPNLHVVEISTGTDDHIARIGLRGIRTDGAAILLNDRSIKLLGCARQDQHPQTGAALSDQQIYQDVRLLKDLGCNFVRGAHYPQDQRFLDLCDEMGLLVWEEYTGWNQKEEHFADPRFLDAQLQGVRRMIDKSFNHPSVILWGFLNEGVNARPPSAPPAYHRLVDEIRRLDPSRLVSCANLYYEEYRGQMPQVDVVSYNLYPGWYYGELDDGSVEREIREWVQKSRDLTGQIQPFLISELGSEALYGCRDPMGTRWTEQYQARQLGLACREAVDNPDVAGIAIWAFHDFRSGDTIKAQMTRAGGYNNKGIFDRYRNPKLACDVVARIFREAVDRT